MSLVYFLQVCVLPALEESVLRRGVVVVCVSQVQTLAARQAVWGPAEGAGAAGAAPAAWRETRTPMPAHRPALPQPEKVWITTLSKNISTWTHSQVLQWSRLLRFQLYFIVGGKKSRSDDACLVFTGDSMQYGVYPVERDCYQTVNTNYKALRYETKHTHTHTHNHNCLQNHALILGFVSSHLFYASLLPQTHFRHDSILLKSGSHPLWLEHQWKAL